MQAIVYICTAPGKALEILEKVRGIDGVKFAAATTGRFDVVTRVEVADLSALGEAVVSKIQGIDGVRRTESSLIVE